MKIGGSKARLRRDEIEGAIGALRSGLSDRQTGAREIEQRGAIVGLELARSTGACDRRGLELARSTCACDWRRLELARSTGACDRRGLELGVCRQLSDWTGARSSSSRALALSLSLSLSLWKYFEVKMKV